MQLKLMSSLAVRPVEWRYRNNLLRGVAGGLIPNRGCHVPEVATADPASTHCHVVRQHGPVELTFTILYRDP